MGLEPMNNGFAGRRVSHFATGAHLPHFVASKSEKPVSALLGRAVKLDLLGKNLEVIAS